YCKKFHPRLILPVNLLFVCSKNKWRSPTAETLYRHDPRVAVRSAGISSSAKKKISAQDLNWADLILVMENKHKKAIAKQYRQLDLPNILVLDIPDDYQYMSAELIDMIQTSTEAILSNILS
ncbi:MAG: protein tyrosine phosphatase, partial [Cyanobacteria bacterium J06631_2]